MKEPESKTKLAKTPDTKPKESPLPDPQAAGLPTTEQIAIIAATLAGHVNGTPDALADAAMALWFASRKKIFLACAAHTIMAQDGEMLCDLFPDLLKGH